MLTVLALSGALVAPTAVQAREKAHLDQVGDVTDVMGDTPTDPEGDIGRTRYRHTKTRVQVRVRFRALSLESYHESSVRVVTNEGLHRLIVVSMSAGAGALRTARISRVRDGKAVHCSIYTSIDDLNDVIIIAFPRSCISRPRWVRISHITYTYNERFHGLPRWDDSWRGKLPYPNENRRDLGFAPYKYSPRIYHG